MGIKNIFVVIWYKLTTKYGVHPVCKLKGISFLGPFFHEPTVSSLHLIPLSSWTKSATLFSHIEIPLHGIPPKWTTNPLSGEHFALPLKPWWKISDFNESIGDIKLIWELSRMNWVIAFAQRARNGDKKSLINLNKWLEDWLKYNPPYLGPNWKCGQEASIRLINLCCAALILDDIKNTTKGLQELIRLHLQRISATISYGIAQDNNHGTSEAAALFIGGSWLDSLGSSDGKKYESLGRKFLYNRTSKLIQKDGSFSQYSLNYHRMVLDSFSIVELWRRKLGAKALPSDFYESASKATSWLYQMVCPKSGEGPNLGANDGSLILQLTNSSYTDYRPSVQLSANLFQSRQAYLNIPNCDFHLSWLGLNQYQSDSEEYVNCDFDSGGYKILRSSAARVFFRYPKFKFRPSQADAMHIDFWIDSFNFFGDAGSFSYNSVPDMSSYFSGTASHNTIQFDDRDQMPRLGRFLFGSWLQSKHVTPVVVNNNNVSCSASYIDYKGASHNRKISLKASSLSVIDRVSGFRKKAVISWRLPDSQWIKKDIKNGIVIFDEMGYEIKISSNESIVQANIVQGWKSLFYAKKVPVSIVKFEISSAGIITTDVSWNK